MANTPLIIPKRLLVPPQEGTKYWHFGSDGEIRWSNWHGDSLDTMRLTFGNVFYSKQDATRARDSTKGLLWQIL